MDLYYINGSPPCRAVLMAVKLMNVNLNLKFVDLTKSEQLKPEYLKINPQHTVPALSDNGFNITESRAILIYLAEKFDKNNTLYPKDLKIRTIINQRLFFDLGTLYLRYGECFYKPIFGKTPATKEDREKIEEAMKIFDGFLNEHKYTAGDLFTVADLAFLATISTYEASNFDISKYANIQKWYTLCKNTLPAEVLKVLKEDTKVFKEWIESMLKK